MQRFDVVKTAIEGVHILKAKPIGDNRGYFERFFCAEEFKEAGFNFPVAQMNHSYSRKGILRGMHYQLPPHAEFKIVRCIRGEVYDVAVDIRKGSPTFLQHVGVKLSAAEHNYLLLPKGTAHGVLSLSEEFEILYLVSTPYCAEAERGLNPLDPALNIKWPGEILQMSPKDESRPFIDADFEGIDTALL